MTVIVRLKDQASPASSISATHGRMTRLWQNQTEYQLAKEMKTVLMVCNASDITTEEPFLKDYAWKRALTAEKEEGMIVRLVDPKLSAAMASTVVMNPTSLN